MPKLSDILLSAATNAAPIITEVTTIIGILETAEPAAVAGISSAYASLKPYTANIKTAIKSMEGAGALGVAVKMPSLLIAVFAIVPVLTAAYDGGETFIVQYWDQIKGSVEKIKTLATNTTMTSTFAAPAALPAAPAPLLEVSFERHRHHPDGSRCLRGCLRGLLDDRSNPDPASAFSDQDHIANHCSDSRSFRVGGMLHGYGGLTPIHIA